MPSPFELLRPKSTRRLNQNLDYPAPQGRTVLQELFGNAPRFGLTGDGQQFMRIEPNVMTDMVGPMEQFQPFWEQMKQNNTPQSTPRLGESFDLDVLRRWLNKLREKPYQRRGNLQGPIG